MKTILAVLILATFVFGETIKDKQIVSNVAVVSWDANTESDLSHYTVYMQFNESTRDTTTDQTQITIPLAGFWPDNTFYEDIEFSVTASDFSGNESARSNSENEIFAKARTLAGDYNQDGMVTALDIARCKGGLGSSIGDLAFLKTADVNGDGTITAFDIAVSKGNLGQTL